MNREKLFFLLVLALLAAFAGWLWDAHEARVRASEDRSADEIRKLRTELASSDSARDADAAAWAMQVRRASSDSLAAWLRARAARPLPARIDSILVPARIDSVLIHDLAHDTVPALPVCLDAMEARRLLLRDSVLVGLSDSLRGSIRLDSARLDSLRALVVPQRTSWRLLGASAVAGYIAGLASCIATR